MADPASREALVALQDLLRPRLPMQGLRWVAPADLHLTLHFLGTTPVAGERAIVAALAASAAHVGAIPARTGSPRWWPSSAEPRALVLQVDSRGALERFVRGLASALREAGVAPQPRRFRAHLTLARAVGLHAPAVDPGGGTPRVPLRVDRLALLESVPRGEGARYREVEGWALRTD